MGLRATDSSSTPTYCHEPPAPRADPVCREELGDTVVDMSKLVDPLPLASVGTSMVTANGIDNPAIVADARRAAGFRGELASALKAIDTQPNALRSPSSSSRYGTFARVCASTIPRSA